ncbi:tom1-like protein 2 [Phtheirospermum japonicum]|uniref:Tom1-like protein 2 n=1 Tax=Phtheirospermum japonicum TaxID=374723 RepID=A0A830BAY7_9LAMI|nr:tom1-like protein 2 [Phtheirospermum japonicum]
MISSMASISSSSSATVRVEKATSEFLIGPDWTLNIDICDTINSNQMLAKDVVKAVKKRLLHKNPKVQLLSLTLLETMVKNCGDFVHFQIAERNILPEMVKIVRKKADMHVRDKILTLIGSWHDAFGGPRGRYPQYHMAYEDLRRSGVNFPQRPPDAAPIFTPPVTHPMSRQPQPGYGMPSSSSTRLDEVMAADGNLSSSSLNSMRDVLDLLTDMLQAVDPRDRSAIKDEVITDLVEQCRANQRKLIQLLANIGDEELLGQGLDLNDSLQIVLARYDSIASGSPMPPTPEVKNDVTPRAPEKHEPSPQSSSEVTVPNATSNGTPPIPGHSASRGSIDEEDEEEDDFALLARRHSKTRVGNTSNVKNDVAPPETSSSPAMSNALVPIDAPVAPARSPDQDIIDLLSITLSTDQTSQAPSSSIPTIPSTSPAVAFSSSDPYPLNPVLSFNNYIAPWAQPQPQPLYQQPQPFESQPHIQSRPRQPQDQLQSQYTTQLALRQQPQPQPQLSAYPPPPWAATPGYQRPFNYSNPRSLQHESINGERAQQINSGSLGSPSAGPKPYIPTYRLFEDLDVFGNNADGRFQSTSNSSPSLSGATNNNHNTVGGRK